MNRTRRVRPRVLLLCLAMVTAACGNRLSHEEILGQNVVRESGPGRAAGPNDAATGSVTGAAADGTGTGTDTGTGTGSQTTVPGAATPGGAVAAGQGAPLRIGLIGSLSGLAGTVLNPARDAWVAWQRTVNAAGGIDGHHIELLTGDDGGDAATSLSIARDFVEHQGVVALTYIGQSTVLGDYAAKMSVPIVGTITSGEVWTHNPFVFAPFGSGDTISFGAARLMRLSGAKKIATLYCAESGDCADGNDRLVSYAQKEGLEIVAQIQYSVTAPDYTAECLRLRNAGAQAVLPMGDNSSLVRMVQSCARQNVHLTWVIPSADDSMAAIPEFEGSIALTPVFPWFIRSGSPAIDEYVRALQTYAPDRLAHGTAYQAWGWQSAKLLEAAARGHLSAKPTSQDILNGLWSLHGETFGGLASGAAARSYAKGQPSVDSFCVFNTRIVHGAWTAPQGLTPECR